MDDESTDMSESGRSDGGLGLHLAAMIEEARVHRLAGRSAEALAILGSVLKMRPGHVRGLHQQGITLLVSGRPDQAVQSLNEALAQKAANADILADLGQALDALGDILHARQAFRRSLALVPRGDLVLRFGTFLARREDQPGGLAWLRRALALDAHSADARLAIGSIHDQAGQMRDAMQAYHAATVADAKNAPAFMALADVLDRMGAPANLVMTAVSRAAELMPEQANMVTPLIQYRRDIGDEETANRMATRLIDAEMARAEKDEIGALGIRILNPDSMVERIGELAFQLDLHVKMKMLGWLPPFVSILLAPKERVCNAPFLDYWRPFVTIVEDPKLIERLEPLKGRIGFNPVYVRLPNGQSTSKARAYFAVQEEWLRQGRGPLLALTQRHVERGREALREMGVPDDAWFACVHVREPGYLKEAPDSSEAARNGDIHAYLPAIEELTRRGGWVIRLGDPSMRPLPPMPQVIDYAVSPFKSPELDVILPATCRFLLGTTSGMVMISELFGAPVGAADYYPIGGMLHTPLDVIIPKPYRERATGRVLFFEEYLKMPFAFTYDSNHVASLGLEALPSEPEDIRELVIEMLERTQGEWPYDADDEKLNARWHEISKPFTLGQVGCRVGRGFLRRHRHLFKSL
jgi:putative glycosyltransferase (TIGR04372 family)